MVFAARLTQRGHRITGMDDLLALYEKSFSKETVEAIAESVGYESVEHFNRLFKKIYGMTPVQYRNREGERG